MFLFLVELVEKLIAFYENFNVIGPMQVKI